MEAGGNRATSHTHTHTCVCLELECRWFEVQTGADRQQPTTGRRGGRGGLVHPGVTKTKHTNEATCLAVRVCVVAGGVAELELGHCCLEQSS